MSASATKTNVTHFPKTRTTESTSMPEETNDYSASNEYNILKAHALTNKLILNLIEMQTKATITSEEEQMMDWQEKYLDKLDRDISDMKNSLRATEERIAGMVNQALSEMGDRDNQRHTEFLALRSDNAETRRWVIGMAIGSIGVALAAVIGIVSVVIGR